MNPWAASFPATHPRLTLDEQRAIAWNLGFSEPDVRAMSNAELASLVGGPINAVRFVPPAESALELAELAGRAAGRAGNAAARGLTGAAPWLLPALGLALAVYVWSVLR